MLWKATATFVTCALLPSLRLHGTTRLPMDEFSLNFLRNLKFYPKLRKVTGTLHAGLCTVMVSRWILLRKINVSDNSCREKQKSFYIQKLFLLKWLFLRDNVEKYGRGRQATCDYDTAHAQCVRST